MPFIDDMILLIFFHTPFSPPCLSLRFIFFRPEIRRAFHMHEGVRHGENILYGAAIYATRSARDAMLLCRETCRCRPPSPFSTS